MTAYQKISFVLTDIDDTLTCDGQLGPQAYQALWNLKEAGFKLIPITGRPAGWCEMIARQWPVEAVVGENGAFYFRYEPSNQKMIRYFAIDEKQQKQNRKKLDEIQQEIFKKFPNAGLASDQFCRLFDLAIDFCEDVPTLPEKQIEEIINVFKKNHAQVRLSSIHINGWFGDYNKLTTALTLLEKEFSISKKDAQKQAVFIGDSPNDEPMFEYFPQSYGVGNIKKFLPQMTHHPQHLCSQDGGKGFAEFAQSLLNIS